MEVGDLIKHKYGTMSGYGIIVEKPCVTRTHALGHDPDRMRIVWSCDGHVTEHSLTGKLFEVISGNR